MTATAPVAGGSRLPTLTGMRFIAALMVFLGHASAQHLFADPDIDSKYARIVEGAGYVGVSFFFILSGFVLTWSARPGDTVTKFWRRRAAKIYPSTVAAVLLAWLCLSITDQAVEADVLVPNLLLVHTWVPDIPTFLGVNAPTWSLGCEVFFYALFPLLLPLLRRIPARHLWTAAVLVVAAIAALPLVAQLLPGTPMFPPPVSESFPRFWFVYGFPPARILEFVLGIVMALIVHSGRWVRIGMGPAALLALAAFVALKYTSILYTIVAVSVAPLALLVAAAAVADIEERRSPFRGRVALWLGEASFAFYLIHQLVLTYGHRALGLGRTWSTPGAIGILVFLLAVSVAVAGVLYTAVERPSVRYLARSRKDRASRETRLRPVAAAPAPVVPAPGEESEVRTPH
ncbi:acyltransferase family protein [Streptomyces sp. NPDC059002]|uniref:acyltransferase family protein n=1 Tax=Streptomyces sp. NPDC059002 TaxID=3346690 RepID=UPI0036CF41A0